MTYEISKLEALRWTMRTWARVYYKNESKSEAAGHLHMPKWFPFHCGCCAYVAGEPTYSMSSRECLEEYHPCPMLDVWGKNFDLDGGVPCEEIGSPYRIWMNDRRLFAAQDIFLGARRLYLVELKRVRERG